MFYYPVVAMGLADPSTTLLFNAGAVIVVLVYNYLPFAILPLYAAAERFDFGLVEAARDLGAGRWQVFVHVILPLTLPGVVTGAFLTFVLCIGDYITPQIVGISTLFLGQAVYTLQGTAGNIPLAAAFSVVPILLIGVYLTLARRMGAFDAL